MTGASAGIKAGCQTYTWEMLGSSWTGGPDDLLTAIADGGYAGIEITDTMIGHYANRPGDFAAALEDKSLTLVAFAMASKSGFTRAEVILDDLDIARRWIDFVARFPGALLALGSATVTSDGPRADKFRVAAEFYNRAAELGRTAGIEVAIHPSSHHETLLFDRGDYDRIFSLVDKDLVGWVPDTGHILRGHDDLADTLRTHRDRIRYLHLKDVDVAGRWAMLGEGVCDIQVVINIVATAPRFNGWLVLEEESDEAATDPAGAVKTNRETLRRHGV